MIACSMIIVEPLAAARETHAARPQVLPAPRMVKAWGSRGVLSPSFPSTTNVGASADGTCGVLGGTSMVTRLRSVQPEIAEPEARATAPSEA